MSYYPDSFKDLDKIWIEWFFQLLPNLLDSKREKKIHRNNQHFFLHLHHKSPEEFRENLVLQVIDKID